MIFEVELKSKWFTVKGGLDLEEEEEGEEGEEGRRSRRGWISSSDKGARKRGGTRTVLRFKPFFS
eukprot:CAMPEP_0182515114 /NCGR_PEP_ID=MMETSP1321-20130603/37410_1 /TAXON_ID=91990 /ORGANISM="Bolidomonas sp., Strain RCC1657" /LENGTH=64 /DNA_ID=CAMNT_0024722475 /DNA_START=262 /DNA_END=456 /DNA_ORIENTATION=+